MDSLYDREAVRPMWEELARVGVQPLNTPEEVHLALNAGPGTVLVMINSVCGCAAGSARPGVALALQHSRIPDRSVTVFAGVDRAATEAARECMAPLPPSSPSIALFKNGELVFALQRHQIEMLDPVGIAQTLTEAFDEHCTAAGPSIPKEQYEQLGFRQMCSATIPLNRG